MDEIEQPATTPPESLLCIWLGFLQPAVADLAMALSTTVANLTPGHAASLMPLFPAKDQAKVPEKLLMLAKVLTNLEKLNVLPMLPLSSAVKLLPILLMLMPRNKALFNVNPGRHSGARDQIGLLLVVEHNSDVLEALVTATLKPVRGVGAADPDSPYELAQLSSAGSLGGIQSDVNMKSLICTVSGLDIQTYN